MKKVFLGIGVLGLVFAGLASSVYADDNTVIDRVEVQVPVSCRMDSVAPGSTTHTATATPGILANDIGLTTLRTVCNDGGGFAIYAIGYSDDEYGNTEMITDLDNPGQSGTATGNIITGLATSGDVSNWAMKIIKVENESGQPPTTYNPQYLTITNGFSSYSRVPDTWTKVANYTSVTDAGDNALGSKIQTTYRVWPSGVQAPATYEGQVLYTLVHPNDAPAPISPVITNSGYISYNPNASGVTDTMGDQSIGASDTSAELWASNFQRPGYGFAGWTDKFDWELGANDASGNGTGSNAGYHIYGPNATITFTAGQYSGSNPGLSLYAVWVPNAGNLQNYTCPDNTTMPIGTVTALTDQRDNQTYAVAKLADGKCWMIENLRLDNNATTPNWGNDNLSQGFAGAFVGLAGAESANFTDSTVANSLYSTTNITGNKQGYRFPRYNNSNTTNSTTMTAYDQAAYSEGNYYTWSAALANTNDYTGATAQVNGYTSETVNTSICPSGWRLPYGRNTGNGNTAGGFYYLNYKINNNQNVTNATASKKLRAYPNNFTLSGYFNNSSAGYRGSNGHYWSSTTNDSSYAYRLILYTTNISPGNASLSPKNNGYPVRCVSN